MRVIRQKVHMAIFLETKRLCIKVPSLEDIEHWVSLYAESNTGTYLPNTIHKWLIQDMDHFKKYGFSMGSVYKKNRNIFIGRAGLVYLNYDETQSEIEIGYDLHQLHWGKGYGVELARAILNWGFYHLQVFELVAVTRPENKKSQRILEKIGMKYLKLISIRGEYFFYYKMLNPFLEK